MAGDVLMLCYFLFGNTPLFVSHVYLQMGILVITVDLECCRCRAKITKVLDCLKGTFFLLCIYKDGNTSMMQLQIDMYNTTILIYGKINKIVALQTNFPLKAEYEYEQSLF